MRRLVPLLALCFAFATQGSGIGVAAEVASTEIENEAGDHHCPDRESDGSPCGAGCACMCCPGHAPVAMKLPRAPVQPQPHCTAFGPVSVTHHQDDVSRRIFQPPRA